MEIFDLKNKLNFLEEVMHLEHDEWATNPDIERENRIVKKINKYFEYVDNK